MSRLLGSAGAAVIVVAIGFLLGWGVNSLSAARSAGNYNVHFPTTPPRPHWHGPCRAQAADWYRGTGRTDLSSLAAAQNAIVTVQTYDGNVTGLEHAGRALDAAAQTAGRDAPPPCIDKQHLWASMTSAYQAEGFDLGWLDDTDDATDETITGNADARLFKAELPAAWFPLHHWGRLTMTKRTPPPNALRATLSAPHASQVVTHYGTT